MKAHVEGVTKVPWGMTCANINLQSLHGTREKGTAVNAIRVSSQSHHCMSSRCP